MVKVRKKFKIQPVSVATDSVVTRLNTNLWLTWDHQTTDKYTPWIRNFRQCLSTEHDESESLRLMKREINSNWQLTETMYAKSERKIAAISTREINSNWKIRKQCILKVNVKCNITYKSYYCFCKHTELPLPPQPSKNPYSHQGTTNRVTTHRATTHQAATSQKTTRLHARPSRKNATLLPAIEKFEFVMGEYLHKVTIICVNIYSLFTCVRYHRSRSESHSIWKMRKRVVFFA